MVGYLGTKGAALCSPLQKGETIPRPLGRDDAPFCKGGWGDFHYCSSIVISPGPVRVTAAWAGGALSCRPKSWVMWLEHYPMISSTANSICGNATGEML